MIRIFFAGSFRVSLFIGLGSLEIWGQGGEEHFTLKLHFKKKYRSFL